MGGKMTGNETDPVEEEFNLSSSEVAKMLNMTSRSISRFAAAGTLPSHKKGARLRFRKSDVEAFAAKRGTKAASTPKKAVNRPSPVNNGDSSKSTADGASSPSTSGLTVDQLIAKVKAEIDAMEQQLQAKRQFLAELEAQIRR